MQLKIRRLTKSTVRKQPHDDFVPRSGWRFLRFNDVDWSVIGH